MCSIFGVIETKEQIELDHFNNSSKLMTHRGPDHYGYWISEDKLKAFSLSRLALNDLTDSGNQPMSDFKKEFIIIFNGEIYNFKSLKKELINSGSNFNNSSDTEVLIEGYKKWGIDLLLEKSRGMFAFALFDVKKNQIILARDPCGMKPLFYYKDKNKFIFSSEIKSINNYNKKSEIDYFSAENTFVTTSLPPNNKTLFKNINKLNLGEILTLNIHDLSIRRYKHTALKNYVVQSEYSYNSKLSVEKISQKFDEVLSDSIEEHLEADANVGILYSAGLDSSLIAAIAKKKANKKIHLFKYTSSQYNDSKLAKDFADSHNMKLHEVFCPEDELIYDLPKLIYHYEKINKCEGAALGKVCADAKKKGFKALLTGDAADELFAGYWHSHSFYFRNIFQNNFIFSKLLSGLRRVLPGVDNLQFPKWDYLLNPFVPSAIEGPLNFMFWKGYRMEEWHESLKAYNFLKNETIKQSNSFLLDEIQYRMERFMIRADSFGMMESIELRLPYLDRRVLSFALNLPFNKKIKKYFSFKNKSMCLGKMPLRNLAKKYGISSTLINRAKIGTPYESEKYEKKLITEWPLKCLSEFYSIDNKKIIYNLMNIKDNERIVWSFLAAEVFLRLFKEKQSVNEIKEEFKKVLHKAS